MADTDIVAAFQSRTPEQQRALLAKMTPEQKQALHGEIQKRLAAKQQTPKQPDAPGVGDYAYEIAAGVGRGLKNLVTGFQNPTMAEKMGGPAVTAGKMLYDLGRGTVNAAGEAYDEFRATQGATLPQRAAAATLTGMENAPLIGGMVQHAEEGGTHVLSPQSVGAAVEGTTTLMAPEAMGPMSRGLAEKAATAREGALRAVTKTGPRMTRDVVEQTAKDNATAIAKHEAKAAPLREKAATVEQLNKTERDYKPRLQQAYERTRAEANQKYEDVRGKMADAMSDPEFLPDALIEASGKIRGSDTTPTILKDMERRVKRGEGTSFNDLQGYRTEIGRELQKNLPDDVYYAYKGLLERIDDEMGRMAEEQSPEAAEELGQARDFYRRYARAFLDRNSPLRKVLNDPEPHGLLKRFRDKEVSGVEALRQFDAGLAGEIEKTLGTLEDVGAPRGRSPLPAPKIPDPPKPNVLTPEKLTEAKQRGAIETSRKIRNMNNHLATAFVVIDGITAAIKGSPGILAAGVGGRLAYAVMKQYVANALESPKTLEAVGKITAKDVEEVMKLPADQRAGFDQLLMEAQAKGVKLKPGVLAGVFGAAQVPKSATTGPKAQHLKQLRDSYQYTDQAAR